MTTDSDLVREAAAIYWPNPLRRLAFTAAWTLLVVASALTTLTILEARP